MSDPFPVLHLPITAREPLVPGRVWPVEGIDRERLQFRGVRPGEAFTVRDSTGGWFRARLGDPLSFSATAFEAILPPESPLRLALFQAVLGRERMFWVIQKATELGVHWIAPTFTARSLAPDDLEREKSHRWPAAILRAVKQCRRANVPVLLPPALLGDALALSAWREADIRWAMAEPVAPAAPGARRQAPGGDKSALFEPGAWRLAPGAASGASSSAALAVGPEGGWTEDEIDLLHAAGATTITLGGRILRAETAALVGLTILQREHGDWQVVTTPGPG